MKIYEYYGFPGPRRVRMFLAEKGIDGVDFENVDVPAGEHRQEAFLAKNPDGTVPVLETDDGQFVSEAMAICRYFERRQPEPSLMGTTPESEAVIEMWQRRVEQTMYDTIATYFHQGTNGLGALETYQNKDWAEKNKKKYLDALERMDQHLESHTYIAGETYSVADITALCALGFAEFAEIAVPSHLTNLIAWQKNVSSRPSATV